MKFRNAFRSAGFTALGLLLATQDAKTSTLVDYTFENFSDGATTGTPTTTISGLTSSFNTSIAGGVEDFSSPNYKLSLTRYAGSTFYPTLSLTTSTPISLDKIEFVHIHNHTPGYPTEFGYSVVMQIDRGSGFTDLSTFLADSAKAFEYVPESITGPGPLGPGTYTLRWVALADPDTDSDFFGLDNIRLIQNEVPGPLPLLGLGTGFLYSRRIRKRIRSSRALDTAVDSPRGN